jgi:von Willebrand factor type A domain
MLALAAFALALARPAIEAQQSQADRVVLLIDNSASMSAPSGADDDTETTRLDEAKERALEIIDRLDKTIAGSSGKVEITVVSFAASPTVRTGFTSARNVLVHAVNSIEPTDQPADLPAALKLSQALVMQGQSEDNRSTRLVLIGDGAYRKSAASVGTGGAEFRFIRVGPEPQALRDNLGIVAMSARRDLDDPSLVRIFARVANAGADQISTPITLRIDDEPIESRRVVVPGRNEEGAGEAVVTMEFTDAPTGNPKIVSLVVPRADDLEADNVAAIRLASAIPPRVLIVTWNTRDKARRLTRDLLVGAVRAIGSTIVDTIDTLEYARLGKTPGALNNYDLVIYDGVGISWLPPVPTIRFGSRFTPPTTIQTKDGKTIVVPPIIGLEMNVGPLRFASWRRSHPILRQVNLDNVFISSMGYSAASRATTVGVEVEKLATGTGGSPLISLVSDHGVKRLIVGFELMNSNWPTQVSFVVFMTNSIEQLTGLIGETTSVAHTTTEPIVVRVEPGVTAVRIDGLLSLEKEVEPGATTVNLGVLDRVGLYHIEGALRSDRLEPINLFDADESAIETSDGVHIAGQTAPAGSLDSAAPIEIWSWFVLAGLLFLTVEWLLYAWRMRV